MSSLSAGLSANVSLASAALALCFGCSEGNPLIIQGAILAGVAQDVSIPTTGLGSGCCMGQ
eukprot:6708144-Prorocentrum_lima.AAC.1